LRGTGQGAVKKLWGEGIAGELRRSLKKAFPYDGGTMNVHLVSDPFSKAYQR